MSIFGKFWIEKSLLFGLQEDVVKKVLHFYTLLGKDHVRKVAFIHALTKTKELFDQLKDNLQVEEVLEENAESSVSQAIAVLQEILKQEKVALSRSEEERLREEFEELVKDLKALQKLIKKQYALLSTNFLELDYPTFYELVNEESYLLGVKWERAKNILEELKIFEQDIKTIGAQEKAFLKKVPIPTSRDAYEFNCSVADQPFALQDKGVLVSAYRIQLKEFDDLKFIVLLFADFLKSQKIRATLSVEPVALIGDKYRFCFDEEKRVGANFNRADFIIDYSKRVADISVIGSKQKYQLIKEALHKFLRLLQEARKKAKY